MLAVVRILICPDFCSLIFLRKGRREGKNGSLRYDAALRDLAAAASQEVHIFLPSAGLPAFFFAAVRRMIQI